jgi:hypothetical protein
MPFRARNWQKNIPVTDQLRKCMKTRKHRHGGEDHLAGTCNHATTPRPHPPEGARMALVCAAKPQTRRSRKHGEAANTAKPQTRRSRKHGEVQLITPAPFPPYPQVDHPLPPRPLRRGRVCGKSWVAQRVEFSLKLDRPNFGHSV